MIKFQQSQALTSHFESSWSIVCRLTWQKKMRIWEHKMFSFDDTQGNLRNIPPRSKYLWQSLLGDETTNSIVVSVVQILSSDMDLLLLLVDWM